MPADRRLVSARCPSCGARNTQDADWCTLCHGPLGEPPLVSEPAAAQAGRSEDTSQGGPPRALTGGDLPTEVVAQLMDRLAATEAGSTLPGQLRGPDGTRVIGRQVLLAAGGLVTGVLALLLLMWLLGHLL